ncbi:hypothetical protein NLJ89_g11155 [Agrocybe chaxingu]|uniref:Uncharacterized protein n=1 Tax=Agrocybe chaxingu TaxID=84603 RepID=A0A9W8MRF0_9AGAR|nr:hypothetical protein NLJ89_g11155 [Agrocybe chaxingu]
MMYNLYSEDDWAHATKEMIEKSKKVSKALSEQPGVKDNRPAEEGRGVSVVGGTHQRSQLAISGASDVASALRKALLATVKS